MGGGGRSLYLLLEGTLEIVTPQTRFGRQRRAGRLEVGSVVGELSFFDGGPRSAAVRAVTPVALAELTAADFEVLRKRHPDLACRLLADLGRILAGRLRRAETYSRTARSDVV
jgi:CRP/FNR family cyclic AMP-dependent transcriptional regulator